jgi:hypothetical protein
MILLDRWKKDQMLLNKLEKFKYWWHDQFMPTFGFYQSNPHSIPGIRELLCKMGRHDYEARKIRYNRKGAPDGLELECLYCEHKKSSGLPRKEKK